MAGTAVAIATGAAMMGAASASMHAHGAGVPAPWYVNLLIVLLVFQMLAITGFMCLDFDRPVEFLFKSIGVTLLVCAVALIARLFF